MQSDQFCRTLSLVSRLSPCRSRSLHPPCRRLPIATGCCSVRRRCCNGLPPSHRFLFLSCPQQPPSLSFPDEPAAAVYRQTRTYRGRCCQLPVGSFVTLNYRPPPPPTAVSNLRRHHYPHTHSHTHVYIHTHLCRPPLQIAIPFSTYQFSFTLTAKQSRMQSTTSHASLPQTPTAACIKPHPPRRSAAPIPST